MTGNNTYGFVHFLDLMSAVMAKQRMDRSMMRASRLKVGGERQGQSGWGEAGSKWAGRGGSKVGGERQGQSGRGEAGSKWAGRGRVKSGWGGVESIVGGEGQDQQWAGSGRIKSGWGGVESKVGGEGQDQKWAGRGRVKSGW